MRKLFKERKLFKGGNYMRKYGSCLGNGNYDKSSLLIQKCEECSILQFCLHEGSRDIENLDGDGGLERQSNFSRYVNPFSINTSFFCQAYTFGNGKF